MENESQKEFEWKPTIKIPEGKHTGVITKITYKEEPFSYTDVHIKLDDVDIELKYGCPSVLSETSKLGRLLVAFGEEFEVGKKVKPEELLVGKKVQLMTINKKNKDNKEFARVVEDSVKPL